MSNIIQFPRREVMPPVQEAPQTNNSAQGIGVVSVIVAGVWVVIVLLWPLLQWIVSLDVLYQLLRTLYYWRTPGVYAGWTLVMHFTALTALTYFVSVYRPQGYRHRTTAK
jgi:hypothetical protein